MNLRQAAEMALKHLDNVSDWDTTYSIGMAKEALRKAIEQAEKLKPTLWLGIGGDGRVKYTTDSDRALKWKQAGSYRLVRDYYTSPVHAIEQAEKQEPIECMCGICKLGEREWVGLTDEEIESELTKEFKQWWSRHVSVCRAIEAKLKEKNV
jgi:hypothetical protein